MSIKKFILKLNYMIIQTKIVVLLITEFVFSSSGRRNVQGGSHR